jgi:hypothetical protein
MSQLPTPAQIRDTMPLAVLLGVELLDTGPELVRGTLTQTQAFHYPRS